MAGSHEDQRPCQLCGHQPLELFDVPGRVTFRLCRRCQLYQYGELPPSDSYNIGYQSFYEDQRGRKVRTAMVRLNRVAPLVGVPRPRLLDIGCSVGVTLQAAQQRGWDAVGVDLTQDVVQWCCQRGFRAVLSDGRKLPFEDESFDVVTAWHVIEHVADVQQALAEWRRVLRPGGVLAMETPDCTSLKVRLLGRRYRRFWRPEHTYTFSPFSLRRFVEQAGLEIVGRPVLGRLRQLPLPMACYAVAYQAQHGVKRALGISKAFQIFARRAAVQYASVPAAAAA